MLFTSPDPAADPHFAQILLDLQKAAYAVEAELLGDDRIPPLNETLVGLAAFRGYWVVAWDGVQLFGAVGDEEVPPGIWITRLFRTA